MRRWVRAVMILVLVFSCCAGVFGAYAGHAAKEATLGRSRQARAHHERTIEQAWPLFDADQKTLSKLDELARPWRGADASAFLNPMLPWSGDRRLQPAIDRFVAAHGPSTLQIPMNVREVLAQELELPEELPDLKWMTRLGEFDHWNLTQNSPLTGWTTTDGTDVDLVFNSAQPDFGELKWAAKLRLAVADEGGGDQLPLACKQVHQLAVLLWRTDQLVGEAMAVQLFRLEREALEQNDLPLTGSYDEETTAALERVAWAAVGFAEMWTPADQREVRTGRGVLGACGGIREATSMYIVARPLVGEQYPDAYRWLDAQFDGGACDLSDRTALWQLTRDGMPDGYFRYVVDGHETDGGRAENPLAVRALVSFPPAREALGEILVAVGTIDGFKRYGLDAGVVLKPGSPAH